MFSSSSDDRRAHGLLVRALAVLAVESPGHADLLARALGDLHVGLVIGTEAISVEVVDAGVVATPGPPPAGATVVLVTSDLATGLALVDGRATVLTALRDHRLDVRGSVSTLLRAAHALDAFLHGLFRAPSGPRLAHDLAALVEQEKRDG